MIFPVKQWRCWRAKSVNVFQNPDDQIFKYHVMDEVMFGPLNIGMSREEAEQKSLAALKR